MHPFGEKAVVLARRRVVVRLGMRGQPRGALALPFREHRRGDGIRRAKSDEVDRPALPPVRQVPAPAVSDRRGGIEPVVVPALAHPDCRPRVRLGGRSFHARSVVHAALRVNRKSSSCGPRMIPPNARSATLIGARCWKWRCARVENHAEGRMSYYLPRSLLPRRLLRVVVGPEFFDGAVGGFAIVGDEFQRGMVVQGFEQLAKFFGDAESFQLG